MDPRRDPTRRPAGLKEVAQASQQVLLQAMGERSTNPASAKDKLTMLQELFPKGSEVHRQATDALDQLRRTPR